VLASWSRRTRCDGDRPRCSVNAEHELMGRVRSWGRVSRLCIPGTEVDHRDPDMLKPFEKYGEVIKFAEVAGGWRTSNAFSLIGLR
jgi:hypothetical protein